MNTEQGQTVAVGSSDSSAIRARLQQDAETARFVTTAVHYYGEDKEQLAADIEWALARIEYLEGRKQWWMKNAEALTAERNELMNAGDNHAAVAARMKRQIAEFFSSPNAADHARPLGAVACGRLFEEPAGKPSASSNPQKSAE